WTHAVPITIQERLHGPKGTQMDPFSALQYTKRYTKPMVSAFQPLIRAEQDNPSQAGVAKTTIPATPPTAGDWVFLASVNGGLLDKEFTLANHRIGWMMTSQVDLARRILPYSYQQGQ